MDPPCLPPFGLEKIPPWIPRLLKLVVYVVLPLLSFVAPLPAFFLHPASSSPPVS